MIADATEGLTPQARASRVTWLLVQHGELTTRAIMRATGLTDVGSRYLMDNLSLGGVPVWKPAPGQWRLLRHNGDLISPDEREEGA